MVQEKCFSNKKRNPIEATTNISNAKNVIFYKTVFRIYCLFPFIYLVLKYYTIVAIIQSFITTHNTKWI